MPTQWFAPDLQAFFGALPDRRRSLRYAGARLNYELIIGEESEIVLISGSHEEPFGADSLFEIMVPCDSISVCEDGYYPGQTGLNFWYGDPSQYHNRTMQLLKRPDGDLKVWPVCIWPPRHENFRMLWGSNSPSVAYELPPKG